MKNPRLWLCAALFSLSTATVSSAKPNVLVIFADDIGYEILNSHGGLDFETPNLNRMAEQGVRFSRAPARPCHS